jgi:hypothetical protein
MLMFSFYLHDIPIVFVSAVPTRQEGRDPMDVRMPLLLLLLLL